MPHAVDAIRKAQEYPKEDIAEEKVIRHILDNMRPRPSVARLGSATSLQESRSQMRSSSSLSSLPPGVSASSFRIRPNSAAHREDGGVPCYPVKSPLRQATLMRSRSWRSGPLVGVLKITVKHAYGIEVADLRGTSDPYVVVQCGGQRKKTSVIKRTLDPVWNESIELHGKLDDFLASGLKMTLMDWDGDSIGSDDELGQIMVRLEQGLRMKHDATTPREYLEAFSTQGEMAFSVQWLPKRDDNALASPFQTTSMKAITDTDPDEESAPKLAVTLKSQTRRIKVPVLLPSKFDFVQETYERFAVAPPPSPYGVPYYKANDPPVRLIYGASVPKFTVGTGTYSLERPTSSEPRFGSTGSLHGSRSVPRLVRPPSASVFHQTAFESPWLRHAREHPMGVPSTDKA